MAKWQNQSKYYAIINYVLYVVQGVKKYFNFLGLADIKVFGHTYLFEMLLLTGLTLFHTQGVFVSIYTYD